MRVEVEFEDGTVARWDRDDDQVDEIVAILGDPDTLKV